MEAPFVRYHLAVTDQAFSFGAGWPTECDALYFAKTITTSGCIGTALDGSTIDLGLVPIGTTIRGCFKKVVFAGGPTGAVVACQTAKPGTTTG